MDNQEIVDLYQSAKWIVDSEGTYRYWFEYDEEWFDELRDQATKPYESDRALRQQGSH